MKIGIISRKDKDKAIDIAKRVYEFLKDDFEIYIDSNLKKTIKSKELTEKINLDSLIAVGGDGTLIRALKKYRCPILGILYGRVGFLFEVTQDNLEEKLEAFRKKQFFITERSMLSIRHNNKLIGEAVNETAIVTAKPSKLLNFEVFVDDRFAMKVWADGMIVATSVGSTSYALSCGGPIIDPKAHVFEITPLAPFKLSARPLVISKKSKVSLKIEDKEAIIASDGRKLSILKPNEILKVEKSPNIAKFIHFDHETFYKNLSKLIEPS